VELFGIVLAIPAAFVAAAIYTSVMRFVLPYRPINRIAFWLSIAVLSGLLFEWGGLVAMVAVHSRAIVGPAFYPAHLLLCLLALPALANLLIIKKSGTVLGACFTVAFLCSLLALPVVLTQYEVAEALYGLDGTGGPYGQTPTIPMPAWW
jgi:hypothetical protein